jgi:O-antigen/teichoic acid export membrane protein
MDRSFLKHAAVYGAGTILVQAGGFLLLPIYLRCLTQEDYGVLDVTSLLAETLGAVLLLGGFRQALFAFYQQAGDEDERRRVVSAAFLLVAVAGALGLLLLAVAGPSLAGETLSLPLVCLAAAVVLLEPFTLLPLSLIQARTESGMYVIVVFLQFLIRVALCILLVRLLRWGVAGALAASAVTGALLGLVLSARELARGVRWPGFARLGAMVAFALPLVPGGLLFFVMNQGDRFFLLHFQGKAAVGTYALGYKLAMIGRLLSVTPLYMVWSSRMYAVAAGPGAPRAFGVVFTRVLASYVLVGLGLCLFADEIIAVLGGEGWGAAAPIVAPVVLAYLLQCGATLMDAGFFIRRRTGLKLVVTVAATAVMLLLYALLIPPLGAIGAALATLGGFAALAGFTWWATQKIFVVEYEWGRLAALLALGAALWAAGRALPAGWWGLPGKAALLLAAPALAWWTGLVRENEKRHTRELLRHLWGLWRLRRKQPECSGDGTGLDTDRSREGGRTDGQHELSGWHLATR